MVSPPRTAAVSANCSLTLPLCLQHRETGIRLTQHKGSRQYLGLLLRSPTGPVSSAKPFQVSFSFHSLWRPPASPQVQDSVSPPPKKARQLATPPLAGVHECPVSVIIPVYNEVRSIAILVERVGTVMRRRGGQYEIIAVDDGSTDGTARLLKAMAAEREDLRAVLLRRNFGQTAAMAAGFDAAVGDFLVTLDADLQNDPSDIPALLDHLLWGGAEGERRWGSGSRREDGGFDMVCGWRKDRKDSPLLRNLPSKLANGLISWATGVWLHDYGCSLKAYRASLVQHLRLYSEQHRFLPALAALEGAAICELPVRHHARAFGESKYGALTRTPRVLLDLLVLVLLAKYRDRPMQLLGLIGGLCLAAASCVFVGGVATLVKTSRAWGVGMAWPAAVPTLVLAAELALVGVQVFCLGFVAELCARTYYESQPRPHYRVREVVTSSGPGHSSNGGFK